MSRRFLPLVIAFLSLLSVRAEKAVAQKGLEYGLKTGLSRAAIYDRDTGILSDSRHGLAVDLFGHYTTSENIRWFAELGYHQKGGREYWESDLLLSEAVSQRAGWWEYSADYLSAVIGLHVLVPVASVDFYLTGGPRVDRLLRDKACFTDENSGESQCSARGLTDFTAGVSIGVGIDLSRLLTRLPVGLFFDVRLNPDLREMRGKQTDQTVHYLTNSTAVYTVGFVLP